MSSERKPSLDVREACLAEALKVIETDGVEALSMREVARRLGISHQAPYKHFKSRDHILAEIVARAYDSFAAYLDSHTHADPAGGLAVMGQAYFEYAQRHSLQFRLMFNTTLPDPTLHPEMMAKAKRAFALLRDAIAELPETRAAEDPAAQADLDALFVWSTIHGLSTLMHSDATRTLELSDKVEARALSNTLLRIGTGIDKGYHMKPGGTKRPDKLP